MQLCVGTLYVMSTLLVRFTMRILFLPPNTTNRAFCNVSHVYTERTAAAVVSIEGRYRYYDE